MPAPAAQPPAQAGSVNAPAITVQPATAKEGSNAALPTVPGAPETPLPSSPNERPHAEGQSSAEPGNERPPEKAADELPTVSTEGLIRYLLFINLIFTIILVIDLKSLC